MDVYLIFLTCNIEMKQCYSSSSSLISISPSVCMYLGAGFIRESAILVLLAISGVFSIAAKTAFNRNAFYFPPVQNTHIRAHVKDNSSTRTLLINNNESMLRYEAKKCWYVFTGFLQDQTPHLSISLSFSSIHSH